MGESQWDPTRVLEQGQGIYNKVYSIHKAMPGMLLGHSRQEVQGLRISRDQL